MVAGNGSGDSPGNDGSSLVRAPTRAAYSFADPDRAVIFPIRAGLQITGCTAVHHTGGLGSGGALANVDDSIIDGYRMLSGAVHEEGDVILAQLGHSAATTHATEPGSPVWAPSAMIGELMRRGQRAHAMSVDEIAEIVAAFGAAAERCRKGGMDGVEILAAFGFLVAAFLSPVANRRTDRYGGSLENRTRFCREVVSAVRDGVGRDGIVGLRIPGDELVDGGLELEEMKAVARMIESDGEVDYLNVIAGTNMDRLLRAEHWPPTPARHGLFVHLAAGIRSAVGLPVFTVGRITDPAQAERILAGGEADMVGMTRAHIADPDLIAKLREGRLEDIRPCVGANMCFRNGLEGRSIDCIHNPQTGRELTWGDPAPAEQSRDVAVIGGGHAGLGPRRRRRGGVRGRASGAGGVPGGAGHAVDGGGGRRGPHQPRPTLPKAVRALRDDAAELGGFPRRLGRRRGDECLHRTRDDDPGNRARGGVRCRRSVRRDCGCVTRRGPACAHGRRLRVAERGGRRDGGGCAGGAGDMTG